MNKSVSTFTNGKQDNLIKAIKAAKEGAKILNLGATPPEAETLEVYKRKWGGQEYNYRCIEMKSLLGKLF